MPLPQDTFREGAEEPFLTPDNLDNEANLISKEDGGVAISNPSQGLSGYTWVSSYAPLEGNIILSNLETDQSYTILTGIMNVMSISFSFDSNMRPVIAYTISTGEAYHYWYDTVTQAYTTTLLPVGAITPKLTHDDKRKFFVTNNRSDVLLFYVLNTAIRYRLQRERYNTDHQIATVTAGTRIKRVGMTTGVRIQLELTEGSFISSP